MNQWLYTSIWSNKAKSRLLLIAFPILLFLLCLLVCLIIFKDYESALLETKSIFATALPIIIIRWIISILCQKKIVFKSTWAKEISRKDNPKIYNIVENLCISKWIPTPKIWIIQDSWMNAFATWRWQKDSWIVFTTWLIDRLEDDEIEAVAWHELTHILNKDCRLMLVIVVYIGIITTLWQILIRTWAYSSNDNDKWKFRLIIMLIWIVLLLLWYLFYPLIRLAISRKREFLADAGSVILTKDNQAMISALKKISTDPSVDTIQQDTVAAMCIENPLKANRNNSIKKLFTNMLSTHPSTEDRIKALENY